MGNFGTLDVDFLEEWLKYGEQRKEEPYQFISYYIAFNFLYNKYERDDKTPERGGQRGREFSQIEKFIKIHYYNNAKIKIDFGSLFEELAFDSEYFIDDVKSNQKNNRNNSVKFADKEIIKMGKMNLRDKKMAVEELFYAIYLVRCNLFHGNKKLINEGERNLRLLEDGSKVLKRLLKDYLKAYKNYEGGY